MRVRIISVATLKAFMWSNAQSTKYIEEWIHKMKIADWDTPAQILDAFPRADLLGRGSQRVVFDLGGNRYRMICKYYFIGKNVKLYVCWLGTHAEYTRLCNRLEQFTVADH